MPLPKHNKRERVLKSIIKNGFIFDKDWIEKLLEIGLVLHDHGGYPTIRKRLNGKDRRIRIARLIMDCPSNLTVDHINRNRKDNRRKNLRVVTLQENLKNKSKYNSKKICALCGRSG